MITEHTNNVGGYHMRARITVAALTVGLVLTGCSSSSPGLDNTSTEYQDGWNRIVSFDLYEKGSPSEVLDDCTTGIRLKKDPDPNQGPAFVEFFQHWEYNDHQRKEWAHGCLDAERNLTDYKVAQQSWEG
jgi:hypothetical protein